jgi:hypothetical protein
MAELGLEMGFGCEVLGVVLVVVLIEEMQSFDTLLVEFLQFFQLGFSVHLHSGDSFNVGNIFNTVTIVHTLTNNKITTFYCSE